MYKIKIILKNNKHFILTVHTLSEVSRIAEDYYDDYVTFGFEKVDKSPLIEEDKTLQVEEDKPKTKVLKNKWKGNWC